MPSAPPQSLQPLGFAYTLPPGRNYDPSREKRSTDAEKNPSIPTAHCTRWRWLTSCPQFSNSTQIPRTDPPMPVPNTPRTELPQAHTPDELKLVSSNPQQRTLHELSSTTPHASFHRRQNSPTPAHNPHSTSTLPKRTIELPAPAGEKTSGPRNATPVSAHRARRRLKLGSGRQ